MSNSEHNDQSAVDRLPEAFTANIETPEPELKEIYSHDEEAHTHTSTGLNRADQGSAESFPASDPPSAMGGTATLPDSNSNAG